MKKIIALFLILCLPSILIASDINCIVGSECSESRNDQEMDCTCPDTDPVGTGLSVLQILTLPLQIFSSKPNLVPAGHAIEDLAKKGKCQCRPKIKKPEYEEMQNSQSVEDVKLPEGIKGFLDN